MDMKTLLDAIDKNNETIKESAATQLARIDDLSATVSTQFAKVNDDLSKVSDVSDRLQQHDKDIDFLKRHVNDIEQEKLASHIEITGIDKATIAQRQQDLTNFAREVIASFGIQFDPAVVQHAFVRTVEKINMSIVVVTLATIEAKIFIMKKKRESPDQRKIFFDHRLTSLNRALFTASRRVAKEAGGKSFVDRGRIFIVRDNEKARINSFSDLEKYKLKPVERMSVDLNNLT